MRHNSELTNLAQVLRKESTKQERHLWYDFLREYTPPFRRQVTIERYIVDFYCAAVKLAVELDGSQHYEESNIEYDRKRTEVLSKYGISVLRIDNIDVDRNFESMCNHIDEIVRARAKALPFGG